MEYEEIFIKFWGEEVTNNLLGLFEASDNFVQVQVFYNFNLVETDKDDNKFVDTYIAANAMYLVSNDAAIISLRKNNFPPLQIITLQEFSRILSTP